ncbi:MAG: PleD family two-component system response regulator [Thermoplasmata archaeon]
MKTIVVVDDEPKILELVESILTTEGFEVIKALSGQECLDYVAREIPDLILLDIKMPEMDGWMVYRELRANERTKGIPIAMLTVKADTIDRDVALDILDVDDYITKPFSPKDLVSRVKDLVGS